MKSIRMYQLKVLTVIIALIAILVCVSQVNASPAKEVNMVPAIQVSLSQDVEVYEILAYEDIYVSQEFKNLRDKLKNEGRLLQATTSMKKFKAHNKFIISHELIAMREANKNLKGKADEYLTYLTDVLDDAEKFVYNCHYQEGYKVDKVYRINWAGGVQMYLVSLHK